MTTLPDRYKTTEADRPDTKAVSWWFDDDPQSLLAKSPSELRAIGVEVALVVAPRMAEIKRYVGLVCWAMRAKVPAGEYGKWVEGYAELVGVTVRTLGEWRSKAEVIAGVQSPFTSPRIPKSAGQSTQLEETSKVRAPIPAASRVAPSKKSEEGSGERDASSPSKPSVDDLGSKPPSSGHLPQPSPVAPHGVVDAGGSGQSSGGTDNAAARAVPPDPSRLPSDRELLSRAMSSLRDIDPDDAGPVLTTGEAVELRQWFDRTMAAYRKANKIAEPVTPPLATTRRQGTVSRPFPAKAEASTNGHREVKSYFKPGT